MVTEISTLKPDCAGCFMPDPAAGVTAEGASHYLFDLPGFAELPAGVLACIKSTACPLTLMLILRFSSHIAAPPIWTSRIRAA